VLRVPWGAAAAAVRPPCRQLLTLTWRSQPGPNSTRTSRLPIWCSPFRRAAAGASARGGGAEQTARCSALCCQRASSVSAWIIRAVAVLVSCLAWRGPPKWGQHCCARGVQTLCFPRGRRHPVASGAAIHARPASLAARRTMPRPPPGRRHQRLDTARAGRRAERWARASAVRRRPRRSRTRAPRGPGLPPGCPTTGLASTSPP
jgi:hypothetical protein